jgi:hypothetical protein
MSLTHDSGRDSCNPSESRINQHEESNIIPANTIFCLGNPDQGGSFLSHDIVVIIPAYNEALVIGSVVLQTLRYCSHVIVIDDGSQDNTASIAERAGATILRMGVNQGKAHAIMAGFAYAKEGVVRIADIMKDIFELYLSINQKPDEKFYLNAFQPFFEVMNISNQKKIF